MNDRELFDFFAAAALAGTMANPDGVYTPTKAETDKGITWADKAANEAFELAGAMMRARQRVLP